jgi:thymidylate kinase
MEILQILRNHIINNKTSFIPAVEIFSTILHNIEKQLITDLECEKNELHYDQYIARCIDLEGINLIWKNFIKILCLVGLDGCGKSTLADELHRQLSIRGQNSRLLYTPPSQLLPFRSYFDAQPESVRRAFYNLGNLIVSFELKNQQDTISILDRYWPSTIAYQLAKINQDDQTNISWPNYLVQPALIVYIYVDEAERCRRIAQRSIPVTLEEKQLAEQEEFRRRLDFIYRNKIPSTRLHVIDGNRPTSIIANDILNLFQE